MLVNQENETQPHIDRFNFTSVNLIDRSTLVYQYIGPKALPGHLARPPAGEVGTVPGNRCLASEFPPAQPGPAFTQIQIRARAWMIQCFSFWGIDQISRHLKSMPQILIFSSKFRCFKFIFTLNFHTFCFFKELSMNLMRNKCFS
jgi:hypothetical protein